MVRMPTGVGLKKPVRTREMQKNDAFSNYGNVYQKEEWVEKF